MCLAASVYIHKWLFQWYLQRGSFILHAAMTPVTKPLYFKTLSNRNQSRFGLFFPAPAPFTAPRLGLQWSGPLPGPCIKSLLRSFLPHLLNPSLPALSATLCAREDKKKKSCREPAPSLFHARKRGISAREPLASPRVALLRKPLSVRGID